MDTSYRKYNSRECMPWDPHNTWQNNTWFSVIILNVLRHFIHVFHGTSFITKEKKILASFLSRQVNWEKWLSKVWWTWEKFGGEDPYQTNQMGTWFLLMNINYKNSTICDISLLILYCYCLFDLPLSTRIWAKDRGRDFVTTRNSP